MKNILRFELLMPSNTELMETMNESKQVITTIKPLKKIDPSSPIGCFFPVKLEPDATYELLLSGGSSSLLASPGPPLIGSFTTGSQAKPGGGRSPPDVTLTLGEKKIDRIQDPTGKTINFFWRFKTSANVANKLLLSMEPDNSMMLENTTCYLRQIADSMPECLYRRGLVGEHNDRLIEPYSLMHTLFDEIYVLNFTHEPHKWIQCKQRMKTVGISGTRLTMSLEEERPFYDSWLSSVAGRSVGESISIENWCVSKYIINLLRQSTKKVCFLSAHTSPHPKFETILYNCLLTNEEKKEKRPQLFTFNSTKPKEFIGVGMSSEFYSTIVAKFEIAPVSINKIFADFFEVTQSIDCLDIGPEGVFLPVSKKYHITILVHIPRRLFFLPAMKEFVRFLCKQNYPYWKCVLLTEATSRPDPLPLEYSSSDDHRFQILERKEVIGDLTLQNLFGPVPPSKYLLNLDFTAAVATFADSFYLSKQVARHLVPNTWEHVTLIGSATK